MAFISEERVAQYAKEVSKIFMPLRIMFLGYQSIRPVLVNKISQVRLQEIA